VPLWLSFSMMFGEDFCDGFHPVLLDNYFFLIDEINNFCLIFEEINLCWMLGSC
jgi:hypothetical protein